jgi:hypothetical protein
MGIADRFPQLPAANPTPAPLVRHTWFRAVPELGRGLSSACGGRWLRSRITFHLGLGLGLGQHHRDMRRVAYYARTSIGIGAASKRFQQKKEFLGEHVRGLRWV